MKANKLTQVLFTAGILLAAPLAANAAGSGVDTALNNDQGTQGAGGVVNFTGKITEMSCDVTTDSKNKQVELGAWAKSYFNEHDETTRREFKINVEECPDSVTSVAVLFDGAKDANNSTLFQVTPGADSATGVGVKLMQEDGTTQIKPGTVSKAVEPKADGTAELVFYANYATDGQAVEAGAANAVSNFLMVYN